MVLYWYYKLKGIYVSIMIGIDGGGTGCRAVIADANGKLLSSGVSGAANIMTNFDGARHSIILACQQAINSAGLEQEEINSARAYLGLAGANIGDYATRMIDALPFAQCHIDTDAMISLQGAIGDDDGVVAIIGTGSVFIYRANGKVHTVGGWGFMVGDLGSGSRLGRTLLQETLLSFDGIQNGSGLTDYILAQFENNPQTIVEYAHTAKPGEFGKFAPAIFDFSAKNDTIAKGIVSNAVRDIEETLDVILTGEKQKICLLGGLGGIYADLLDDRFKNRISEPMGNAADGALALCREKYALSEGMLNG